MDNTCATLGHSFQREDFDPSDRTPDNGWVVDRPADCLNDGRGTSGAPFAIERELVG